MTSSNDLQKNIFKEPSRVLEILEASLFQRTTHLYLLRWDFWLIPSPRPKKKEKVVDWLSHISRFRDLGEVFSHKLRHLLRLLHYSKLVSFQRYLRHMMFDEILSHHFYLVRDLDGMSVRAKKFQRSFLTLGFVLGQAKFLPVTQDCCSALRRSFLALM